MKESHLQWLTYLTVAFFEGRETTITFCHISPLISCSDIPDVNVSVWYTSLVIQHFPPTTVWGSNSLWCQENVYLYFHLLFSIITCQSLNMSCASVILDRKPQGALQNLNVLMQLLAFTRYFPWKGYASFLPTIPTSHPAKPSIHPTRHSHSGR